MLKSKVIGEKLANKEMKAIYGGGCNCLPGCDCTSTVGRLFYIPFDKHMLIWVASFAVALE